MRITAAFAVLFCCLVTGYASYTTLTAISSRNVCAAVDRQAHVLRAIIIQSTKDTHRQEAAYRKLHLPPYSVRIRKARVVAASIPGCP